MLGVPTRALGTVCPTAADGSHVYKPVEDPEVIGVIDFAWKLGDAGKTYTVIGSGPIVIGQACEFDYSGAQACKALRQEGFRVVLVNSNPATIMTDPEMADVTYIEPITWQVVEKIIEKERPDALLPTMGGQTALNVALALERSGVLARWGVEMIGARAEVIDKAEDRQKFRDAMDAIGLESPRSRATALM